MKQDRKIFKNPSVITYGKDWRRFDCSLQADRLPPSSADYRHPAGNLHPHPYGVVGSSRHHPYCKKGRYNGEINVQHLNEHPLTYSKSYSGCKAQAKGLERAKLLIQTKGEEWEWMRDRVIITKAYFAAGGSVECSDGAGFIEGKGSGMGNVEGKVVSMEL